MRKKEFTTLHRWCRCLENLKVTCTGSAETSVESFLVEDSNGTAGWSYTKSTGTMNHIGTTKRLRGKVSGRMVGTTQHRAEVSAKVFSIEGKLSVRSHFSGAGAYCVGARRSKEHFYTVGFSAECLCADCFSAKHFDPRLPVPNILSGSGTSAEAGQWLLGAEASVGPDLRLKLPPRLDLLGSREGGSPSLATSRVMLLPSSLIRGLG